MKWKHKTIKGSGYGQVYSPPKPPRDKSRDKERDILGYNRSRRDTRDTQRDTSNDGTDTKKQRGLDTQNLGTRRDDMLKLETSPKKQPVNKNSSAWSPAEVSKHKVKGLLAEFVKNLFFRCIVNSDNGIIKWFCSISIDTK